MLNLPFKHNNIIHSTYLVFFVSSISQFYSLFIYKGGMLSEKKEEEDVVVAIIEEKKEEEVVVIEEKKPME